MTVGQSTVGQSTPHPFQHSEDTVVVLSVVIKTFQLVVIQSNVILLNVVVSTFANFAEIFLKMVTNKKVHICFIFILKNEREAGRQGAMSFCQPDHGQTLADGTNPGPSFQL